MSRTLPLTLLLLAGCGHDDGARDSARTRPSALPAESSRAAPSAVPLPVASSLVGDTLQLTSFAGRPLPDSRHGGLPCDSAGTPLLQRMTLDDDSTYSGITVLRPGCRDPLMSSSDTLVHASSYAVRGDTLMLFSGDGDEVYQWFNGRILPDSVIPLARESEGGSRYVRRHRGRPAP